MYRCRNINKIYSSKCSVCTEYNHSLLQAIDNKLLFILSLIRLYCIMICLSLSLFCNLSRTLNKFYKRFNEEGLYRSWYEKRCPYLRVLTLIRGQFSYPCINSQKCNTNRLPGVNQNLPYTSN